MTPQERDLLSRFLDDLARSRPGPKDAEAADQIERSLRGNPDAAYVLVQHAILSDQALNAAQGRIAELEQQQQQATPGAAPQPDGQPSFLGAAFGKANPNPPTTPAGMAVPPTGAQPGYGGYAPPPADAPYGGGQSWGAGQPGPFSGGGGIGNFLRSAGTTAAGVAGGAFLFEGLSGLFGGHRGGMGFGGGPGFGGQNFSGFGGGSPVENVTINDFGGGYDSDRVDYDSDNGDPLGDDYS